MALALGAPGGWLVLQTALGANPARELLDHAWLYIYLLVPTVLVFTLFGGGLGRAEDRLERANQRLDQLSITDPLTGLSNVRYFRARMVEEAARADRSGEPLALAILDLDHFKMVNDRHGHAVGDDVLVAAATALRAFARQADTVARIGGEEFAMIMPATDATSAYAAVERARRAVERVPAKAEDGSALTVTASAGVAVSTAPGGLSMDDLFREADDALYEAKRRGRDRTAMREALAHHPRPAAG
ncbi:MAG TPA: GGDEF domain-containing protein [Candidatus Dormibacteraeota bacterium]|nr:GGDEF domain-containing protein [Candidatus Dormibacteraeota bacterium]